MITVPLSFREMPRWWGDAAGRAWLDELPARVERQCRRWQLDLAGELRHGSNALVVPVRRDGLDAVLRLAPPGDDVAREAAALRHWDGRGVVQLFAVDEAAGAALLERLDPTRTLLTEPVQDAVRVLGTLARQLAVPAPADVRGTREIAAASVSSFVTDWEALDEPTSRDALDRAVAAATALATAEPGNTSVDGDLHFEQVLAGARHRWTVVDPVLLRGDPEYDLGRVLWTRLDELPADRDVHAAFAGFVAAADVPAERARSWVVVRSMSYLLWGLPRGLTWDPPKCRRLLDLFA